ncbi:alpha/beta fold hydrolase [Christensenella timonensis]|uniref:alpha/beta fold hydrolase n=1 Tax=Christensenella timonensis TaxID=1816678 RepID=UPI0008362ADC|nr:alpha/beta fold hydrolase [Christensenella timonensis]
MKKKELEFASADGKSKVYACCWQDEKCSPRFLVQICHGMCEYIERYEEFADFLCAQGAAVFGNDHLGHGRTKAMNEPAYFGYFAEKDGEKLVVKDVHTLTTMMKEEYPGLPLVLIGHSMGSMVARSYMTKFGEEADCAVFMGTSGANNLTGVIRFLARVGMIFGRAKKPAKLLDHLAFSKYNDRYEDVRSEKDWITRDRQRVEEYLADPLCMFLFTDRAAYDFANLLDEVSGVQWAQRLPKEKPYLLVSGEMDPVGNYGDGVREVYGWMKQAGMGDATMKLYPGARHEILNEINRDEVKQDIFSFISARVL